MSSPHHVETFTPAERARLSPYVTNLDGPVFALTGLPQVTCAALFARYSRSAKSLRRMLLDEFLGDEGPRPLESVGVGQDRARELFGRVLAEYGDDSVAQLAGAHLACEQVSQPVMKIIERGRLASYLEQSTRYLAYTDRRDGHYRYRRDAALLASPVAATYLAAMDGLFDTYTSMLAPLREHLDRTISPAADPRARQRAIRTLALDLIRGLLPCGTVSNVGVFASPQAYEQLVLRLRAHPLPEAREYADLVLVELKKVIPEFLTRLDRPDRGGVWVDYLSERGASTGSVARELVAGTEWAPEGVTLVDWDGDAEDRILANALFPHAAVSLQRLMQEVRALSTEQRERLFNAAVGSRRNRRHRPGRGFEHADYTFEIVSDYGAFKDLQRHRLLTIEWQALTPALGYGVPVEVQEAGLGGRWREAVAAAEEAHRVVAEEFPEQAAYLVTHGHRIRYSIKLNAREAMHMIELRTSPQGHPAYRRVCREMHRLIDEVAEHHLVAGGMGFVGAEDTDLPRYEAEARSLATE